MAIRPTHGERRRGDDHDREDRRAEVHDGGGGRQSRPPALRPGGEVPSEYGDQRQLERRSHEVEWAKRLGGPRFGSQRQPDHPGGRPHDDRSGVDRDGHAGQGAPRIDEIAHGPTHLEPGEYDERDAIRRILREVLADHSEMDRGGAERQSGRQHARPDRELDVARGQPAAPRHHERADREAANGEDDHAGSERVHLRPHRAGRDNSEHSPTPEAPATRRVPKPTLGQCRRMLQGWTPGHRALRAGEPARRVAGRWGGAPGYRPVA